MPSHSHPPFPSSGVERPLVEHLGPVLEAMPIPMLFVDASRRVRLWNRTLALLLDRPAESIAGRTLEDLVDPRDRAGVIETLEPGRSGRTGQVSRLTLPACSGQEMMVTWLELVDNDQIAGWLVRLWSNPPTARLERPLQDMLYHEKALRDKLTALLTVSQTVVQSLDLGTILATITQQVRAVIQVDECTVFMLDERDQMLKPVACDVKSFREEVMGMTLKVGEGITGTVALTGKGEIVNVAESDPRAVQVPGTPEEQAALLCVPLPARERVLGVLTLARIGTRFFVQEDLELATLFAAQCSTAITNARMYEQVKQAYDELREAQAQLVQSAKLTALGEMAGGVAHDFNNILSAILGRTQLLQRGSTDPEMLRQLRIIEQAALDGAMTVRRVQEFTRVRHDERFETLDVNPVLLGVVELTRSAWQTRAKERGIPIEARLDLRSRGTIAGNPSELREVFTNMVLNAVDAMPAGGRLSISSEDVDSELLVRIRDTGTGMDARTKARVFDPFFTTKPVQGTGLGLSVAYGIVTRHHGHITVESEVGAGTEFTVHLPRGQVEGTAQLSPRSQVTPAALRILVVDDEQAVLDVLVDMLAARGHQVEPALGGEAAIAALAKVRPQVVFSDLGMPGLNGWDIAQRVKADLPGTTVVLVTGWGVQLDEVSAQRRGVDHILPKPFSIEDIERVLGQLTAAPDRRAVA